MAIKKIIYKQKISATEYNDLYFQTSADMVEETDSRIWFTPAEQGKLSGIAAGASATLSGLTDTTIANAVNGQILSFNGTAWVNADAETFSQTQANWDQTDSSAVDFIKNKPTALSDFTNDLDFSDYVTETELATTLEDYVTETALSTTLEGYATTSDLTDGLATKEDVIGTKNSAFNKNFEDTATVITMNGVQAAGTSSNVARADHVHPVDTSRASASDLSALTTRVTAAEGNISTNTTDIAALQSAVEAIDGQLTYLPAHDFGTATPTQEALTAYAKTFETELENSQAVKNLYDNTEWIYNSTSGLWVNFGNSDIATASKNNLGLVQIGSGIAVTAAGVISTSASEIGLGNVDNTSDANKPLSTAATQALALKEDKFTKNTAFNQNFEISTANIKMNGPVSVGGSDNIARADHVHPVDTSRASAADLANLEDVVEAIKLTGDVTGAIDGNGAIATTLANSGVTAGSGSYVTVNAKGLVTDMTDFVVVAESAPSALPIGGFYLEIQS